MVRSEKKVEVNKKAIKETMLGGGMKDESWKLRSR